MVKFQAGVRVKRPVDEVFAYLSDVGRQAEWSNAVQESRREGFGQVSKGTRYRTKIKLLGHRGPARPDRASTSPARP
jgi:hypothetical protein